MERQKKVIDASVLTKWFLEEKDSEKARLLREEHITGRSLIIIPELAYLEVLNALRFKKGTDEELRLASKILFDLNLKIEKLNQKILENTSDNAIKHNLTIYDSIYLSIAELHGIPLVTADSDLLKIPNTISLEKI